MSSSGNNPSASNINSKDSQNNSKKRNTLSNADRAAIRNGIIDKSIPLQTRSGNQPFINKYFQSIDHNDAKYAICNHNNCYQAYREPTSTTNLHNHLKNIHNLTDSSGNNKCCNESKGFEEIPQTEKSEFADIFAEHIAYNIEPLSFGQDPVTIKLIKKSIDIGADYGKLSEEQIQRDLMPGSSCVTQHVEEKCKDAKN